MHLLLAIVLTALGPIGLKALFWLNATLCLSLMNRQIGQSFWRFTPLEMTLSLAMSASFVFAVYFQQPKYIFLPLTFIVSALSWLFLLTARTWRESKSLLE